tara:strand:- start:15226 stop:17409 length:2184 start_codon:yes stop_codon:yes gene_type:complete
MKETNKIEVVKGDGGDQVVTKEELVGLKNEVMEICRDSSKSIHDRRREADDTRFCRWSNQTADGLKHSNLSGGHEAFPFEGASDSRVRLTDMIINEREKILVASAMRADVGVQGLEGNDLEMGARMTTVLKWVTNNALGPKYRRELKKIAQWQEGDVPAGAVMGVYWNDESALENKVLSLEDIGMMLYAQLAEGGNKELSKEVFFNELRILIENEGEEPRLSDMLREISPHLSDRRIKKIIKELRKGGSAVYPSPYIKTQSPTICAHRLFEDIYFPSNTSELKNARAVFIREWLTEAQVRERSYTHGYSQEYIKKVLEQEGETGFPEYSQSEFTGEWSTEKLRGSSQYEYKGMYEQITAYTRSVNDDGVPGIYYTCFNYNVDIPAKEKVLLDYAHGEYPFVWFGRETLTSRLWDSRSVSELGMGSQKMLKILWDSYLDHTTLTTIPPITVPKSRPNQKLEMGPLKQIKENRPGEIKFMEMPKYPSTNDKAQPLLLKQVNEYFGRSDDLVQPALTQLHMQDMVDSFLSNLKEVLHMVLQLCQQYMPDEALARISGAEDGIPVVRERSEIQGKFDLVMSFDSKDLDMEYVMKKAEIIGKFILPIDTLSTIQRDKLVQKLFAGLDPSLASATIQPVQNANMKEAMEEQINFTKIATGVEPPMQEEGQNHQLRLQTLNQIAQANPEAVNRLPEDSKQILQARLDHLNHMIEQQTVNKQYGRLGAVPALQGK